MQDGFVADGHEFADLDSEGIREVDDCAVLNIRARADHDAVDVRAQDALIPHARLLAERHIADDGGICRGESRGVNAWRISPVAAAIPSDQRLGMSASGGATSHYVCW